MGDDLSIVVAAALPLGAEGGEKNVKTGSL